MIAHKSAWYILAVLKKKVMLYTLNISDFCQLDFNKAGKQKKKKDKYWMDNFCKQLDNVILHSLDSESKLLGGKK